MQSVQYPYNKIASIIYTILVLGVLIFFPTPLIIKGIGTHDNFVWILLLFALVWLSFLIYLVIKYLIPALQNKTALEINSIGITSHIKNVIIYWNDIEEIRLVGARSPWLYITFKWKTDHGDSININLQYVKGDDQEICDTANGYLENYSS